MLEKSRPNLCVLHPLPRVNEIAYDVDANPKAYYIPHAHNVPFTSVATLCDVSGIHL